MTVSALLDWLVSGTNDQTLSPEWLQDKLPAHAAWNESQQQPGMAIIVADVATMRRRHFWQAIEARKAQQGPRTNNTIEFRRESQR